MNKRIAITTGIIALGAGVWLITHNRSHDQHVDNSLPQTMTQPNQVTLSNAPEETESVAIPKPDRPEFSPKEKGLSDAVKTLLGMDGQENNYNSLMRAVSKLSKNLSEEDVFALRELLVWSNDQFPAGMRDIEINAVKNDVLDRLLRQNELPEGLGRQMVDMFSAKANDPVWRDYCVQFMTPFYERASPGVDLSAEDAKTNPAAKELNSVRNTMFAALDERGGTLAGTSLIGLELLSRTHNEFDRETILSKASEIAADESASNSSRLTALRMSSITGGDESSANTARSVAQTGETVLLRSAALVTLGETGSLDDRELIESYTHSDNRQIASAAELALQKMDARSL